MKKGRFLNFLEFPFCCQNDFLGNKKENGLRMDFTYQNVKEDINSNSPSNRFGISSIFLLLILFSFSNFSSAQFAIDGDPSDWNDTVFNTFPVRSYVLDAHGTNQVNNQFNGSKVFFLADGIGTNYLGWVIGQTKAKNDIANVATVLDEGILYFSGDRTSNNGDAQIGFWFFLNGTSQRTLFTSPHAGRDFAPAPAVGDILALTNFTDGGGTAIVNVYRWKVKTTFTWFSRCS